MKKLVKLSKKKRFKTILVDKIFHSEKPLDISKGGCFQMIRVFGILINQNNKYCLKNPSPNLLQLNEIRNQIITANKESPYSANQHQMLDLHLSSYWENKNRKNFLIHESLTKYLADRSVHPGSRNMLTYDKDFDIFIEFKPDNKTIENKLVGCFCTYLTDDNGDRVFVSTMLIKSVRGDFVFKNDKTLFPLPVYLEIIRTQDFSLKTYCRLMYKNDYMSKSKYEKMKDESLVTGTFMSQILNTLDYIICKKDDVTFYQNNEIIKKENKSVGNLFSREKVAFLGEEFIQLRMYKSQSSFVRAHIRYQPYKNGLVKPILIDAYTRKNTIPLFDRDTLKDPNENYIQWEKMAREKFDSDIKNLVQEFSFKVSEEFKVQDSSNHRIDYLMEREDLVIGIEYKADEASWVTDKIEAQVRFYDKCLKKRFPNKKVYTFIVSNKGKYGYSHDEIIDIIENLVNPFN